MANQSYIGLGSNLNDPIHQVRAALAALDKIPGGELVRYSSLYESPPMGPQNQGNYINAVAEVRTRLTPLALLGQLARLEETFGRDRTVGHWGPRVIDLDILLFEQREFALKNLNIPHPGLEERDFVVVPLLEIAPALKLPNGRSLREIARELGQKSLKRLEISKNL